MSLQADIIQSLEKLLSKEKLETARLKLVIAEREQTIRLQDKQIASLTQESKAAYECVKNYDKIQRTVQAEIMNQNIIQS